MSKTVTVTEDLGPEAGWRVLEAVLEVLALKEGCLLAVPGGSTPGPVFDWLAANIPEDVARRLLLTLVDERHLPLSSPHWMDLPSQSNTRQLWARWLAVVPQSSKPRLIGFARRGELREVRDWIAADLPHPPDVVLIGVGPDGHIASLFPGHAALKDSATVLAIDDSPKPPPSRLTLSMPTLLAARHAIVIAKGADKAAAMAAGFAGDPTSPLGQFHAQCACVTEHWVLDPASASQIQEIRS